MFFGGNNGLMSFLPHDNLNREPPSVAVTAFKILGTKVNFTSPVSKNQKIELDCEENYFSFEFVPLHYQDPTKNSCAYKLEGYDKDWTYSTGKGAASFKNIQPGEYTFRVKAANCDDVWNENGVVLEVIIHPPFWKNCFAHAEVC